MPNIIVIGGSAGGIEPLKAIVSGLPGDLQAAIFVVMHLSPDSPSMLPKILRAAGPLPAQAAVDGQRIQPGHVYVAPPNYHMLILPDYINVTRGPRENRHRPAIDPLFRTAARAYGPRVLGIVLSGMADDGSMGLQQIKSEGGLGIVQDPDEATFSPMPSNAIKRADVDYILRTSQIASKIVELVVEKWKPVDREEQTEIIRELMMKRRKLK